MSLSDSWVQTALKVTGHFEDSADPLGGVSGDFDGMGLSLGVLQWNIGMGSLQPLVKNTGRAAVVDAMPVFGSEFWRACTGNISQGLTTVRGWQTGQRLRPAVKAELKALAHSAAFVDQQIAAARKVAAQAWLGASTWNKEAGLSDPSLRDFCWFFDLMTQNGGLKGISPSDVEQFIAAAGSDRADDLVCDWLEARTEADAGYKDSIKNALEWRDAVSDSALMLFVASYLRSQKTKLLWRADALNRKGTIVLGTGWVHGEKHTLIQLMD
jgi:hypothetical protein